MTHWYLSVFDAHTEELLSERRLSVTEVDVRALFRIAPDVEDLGSQVVTPEIAAALESWLGEPIDLAGVLVFVEPFSD